MDKLTFKIHGMDCAEEVDALRKALGRLKGVHDLEFDLLNGTMGVSCDFGCLGEGDIREAVRRAGLEAVPWDGTLSLAREEEQILRWRKGRLTACALSGAFAALGVIIHGALSGSLLAAIAAGEPGTRSAFPLASIALYGLGVVCGAWYVAPKAWAAIRSRRADMNLLMCIAVCGAIGIGQWFEAAVVSFLFALALLLESWSVARARHAIHALMDISPRQARCLGSGEDRTVMRPVEEVTVGSEVVVYPGEKIPLDGVVTRGTTSVNQSPITGESAPVGKAAGDTVFAGTINNEGAFEFRTTKAARDTTLARIVRMVEEVQARRAPTEQWVERFARFYTPVMIAIAVAIAVVPPLFGGGWWQWFYQALVVLVIACPCALVISTPVSVVAALTCAARSGVLIKGGAYLEACARLRAIAVDKTGTLTHGQPEVQRLAPMAGHTEKELLERAAALEARSEHPLALAVLRRAGADGISPEPAQDLVAIRGKGAEATIRKRRFWIGSHRLLHEKGAETPDIHEQAEALEDAGHSVVAIGNDAHICGLISVSDTVRAGASEAVGRLKRLGIERMVMLTGDNEGTARAVGQAVGMDGVEAELLPEDKLKAVEALVRQYGEVAMVGDGVNDAPAMAASRVGIAMGAAGTDTAIETADIALMSDDLSRLPWLIVHARRTLRVIRQNIGVALGVKVVFMGLAVAGVATLWMAIAADMGASLLVIFNGLRLMDSRRCG